MNFNETTIMGFFNKSKIKYTIPPYQRAYSWEEQQLRQFFEDLFEHRKNARTNPYCYGNILLQTIKEDAEYSIIDGQQRITTISIFIRAILNEIKSRALETEELCIEDEERFFFKDFGIIKLIPVLYDKACYDTIIIENKDSFNCTTPSQKRMINAKEFFKKQLKELNEADLLAMYEALKGSRVYSINLNGNKEAALMFELQNNRGKDLTNLEKLKSYFMYQIYVYSDAIETEANIDYLSGKFDPIYTIANQTNDMLREDDDSDDKRPLSEDNILLYHSIAYGEKSFAYRKLQHIFDEFKKVPNDKKVQWIKEYVDELYESFTNIDRMLKYDDKFLKKLEHLKMPTFIYPFIIKGMKYLKNDRDKMSELFKILEALSFRYKLIGSRADIRSRLSDIIKSFTGDVEALALSMKKKMEAEYYWSDAKVLETLNGYMYHNNVLHYLLWEYEESIQIKGYKINSMQLEDESIEHISPQNESNEWIEPGYEVDETNHYTKEFEDKYINRLGNLVLISRSHNSSIGNKPFKEKLESFKKNPLLKQQFKISSYVCDEKHPIWDSKAIDARHNEIVSFALKRWSFT